MKIIARAYDFLLGFLLGGELIGGIVLRIAGGHALI